MPLMSSCSHFIKMRNDPWELLNLSRTSATEREVKTAYAGMLKRHRPDTDPEGFQLLHAAYTEALRQLKGRPAPPTGESKSVRERRQPPAPRAVSHPALPPEPQVTSDDDDGENEAGSVSDEAHEQLWTAEAEATTTENFDGTSAEPSEPDADDTLHSSSGAIVENESRLMVPGHLVVSFNALHAACASASPAMLREAFETFSDAAMQAGHGAAFIHRLLKTLVLNDVEFLAHYAPPALLAHYMQDFTDELIPGVVRVWLEEGQDTRAVAFAKALVAVKHLVLNHDTAVMVARLIHCTAFWEPECAAKLLNLAFPHLPPELRVAARLTSIEQQIVVGRLFHGFPSAYKRFWHERLFLYETVPVNWQADATTAAIDYVVNIRGHTWPGWHVIQRFVPEEVWRDMWARMQTVGAEKQPEAPTRSRRRSAFYLAAITGLSFIIGTGPFLFMRKEDDSTRSRRSKPAYSSPPPAPPPTPVQPLVLRPDLLLSPPPPLVKLPKPSSISPVIKPEDASYLPR